MKFGIIAPYQLGPVESGDYARDFARLVEELGFESVWAVEHAVMCVAYDSVYPYDPSGRSPFEADTIQPDPLVWLSWVAAATERLRLATGILILPQRNPVLLAKAVASLDRLSEGRLMLGIGVGWVREEAEAVGTSFHDRGRRADEYVQVLRALWREPVARYQGEFVRFEGVVSEPRPAQAGGVPILVGGHSRAAAPAASATASTRWAWVPTSWPSCERSWRRRRTPTAGTRAASRSPAPARRSSSPQSGTIASAWSGW